MMADKARIGLSGVVDWGWDEIIPQSSFVQRTNGTHMTPALPVKEDCTIWLTTDQEHPILGTNAGLYVRGFFAVNTEVAWAFGTYGYKHNPSDLYNPIRVDRDSGVAARRDFEAFTQRDDNDLVYMTKVSHGVPVKKGDHVYIYVSAWMNMKTDNWLRLNFRKNSINGEEIYSYSFYDNDACYLTTCMVKHYGKDDGGIELTSMRRLRDKYKEKHAETLKNYRKDSRAIVEGIEKSGDKEFWYSKIKRTVDTVVLLVENNEWSKAETHYLNLYYDLKNIFLTEEDK